MHELIGVNKRRAAVLIGQFVALTLIVGLLIGLIVDAPIVGALLGLLVGGLIVAVAFWFGAAIVLRSVGAKPAEHQRYQRFHNVVEGLCVANGIPKPDLLVVEDPAINALVVGRDKRHTSIVVTVGLLDRLSRIELEGVVAHELARIRQRDIIPATMAAVLLGGLPLRSVVVGRDRQRDSDLTACRMTRYPPGLIAALQKVREQSEITRSASSANAHLWFVDPLSTAGDRSTRSGFRRLLDAHIALDQRIALLDEL